MRRPPAPSKRQNVKRPKRKPRKGQTKRLISLFVKNRKAAIPPRHPCVLKESHMLIRVSIPYSTSGALLLGSFPGMKSERHELASHHLLPTMSPVITIEQKIRQIGSLRRSSGPLECS